MFWVVLCIRWLYHRTVQFILGDVPMMETGHFARYDDDDDDDNDDDDDDEPSRACL